MLIHTSLLPFFGFTQSIYMFACSNKVGNLHIRISNEKQNYQEVLQKEGNLFMFEQDCYSTKLLAI